MSSYNSRLELLSAAELGREVSAKRLSPTEVLHYFSRRIEERNPSLNAFVYTRFEEAERAAKKLEARLAKGESAGPFAGVPFALKDFLPSKKGWPNSHGGVRSLIQEDPFDSEFCRAMENAGGIAVGKTNAPAFAFRGTCDNRLYGPTSNPFNTRYNSGGSSGGSAAAGFSLAFLIIGKRIAPLPFAATVMSLVQALLALALGCSGYQGALAIFSYVAPGLIIDVLALVLKNQHPMFCFAAGILSSVTSAVISNLLVFHLAGISLLLWLLLAALSGALGGLVAQLVSARLQKAIGGIGHQKVTQAGAGKGN